ncbi:MAG: ABC transporter ATP-binding protein [Bacteroidetes bacterium]|nr:ABC transporter ATP-binding protein [Bacteroidota bacterium]
MENLLSIEELGIAFRQDKQVQWATTGISFSIAPGEIVALVGESGSGKSITAMSVLGLLPPHAVYPSGRILFSPDGSKKTNLLRMPEDKLRQLRGAGIGMVFQEPMTALNPVYTCGNQVMEMILQHEKISRKEARERVISLFEQVQLPEPKAMLKRYPHQLSGGQKQRVMIAMAIAANPALLIADEPTTALDVTVQKTILDLLGKICRDKKMGMLFITHDLGVVQEIADKVVVMYGGKMMESGSVETIFNNPSHPYTKALLACRPALQPKGAPLPVVSDFWDGDAEVSSRLVFPRLSSITRPVLPSVVNFEAEPKPLLQVEDLSVWYPKRKNWFGKPTDYTKAVDAVSFNVLEGETLGIVGESGCGKSTLGRALLRLSPTNSGRILYQGEDLLALSGKRLAELRTEMQLVFQDPYSSLNPRQRVGEAILEPMNYHKTEADRQSRKDRVGELLSSVNLSPSLRNRYPHAFSGGQRQRIGIARALALRPGFILFDESVSALDVSVQAQVLNLINRLKAELGFTAIFISHDLGVVRYIADRILVMEKGQIVESGEAENLFRHPQHPYTAKLLDSIPGNSVPSRAFHIMP